MPEDCSLEYGRDPPNQSEEEWVMNATQAYNETFMEAGDKWCEDFWCVQLAGAIVGDWVVNNPEVFEEAEAAVDETLQDEETMEII